MNSMIEILQPLTEPLGWTLLNSLWQAALLVALVVLILRIMPLRFSKARYAVACAGILAIFVSSAITFAVLFDTSSELVQTETAFILSPSFASSFTAAPQQSTSWMSENVSVALTAIEDNMSLILIAWSLGALAFSLRLVSGWWFISGLKSESTIVHNNWSDELQALARKLGITKVVQLAESTKVTTPMVIGFLKPLVLVPAGMLSGLTAAQVETIFLHELAHIRRHDYIVNVAQAVIETVFFFNFFVWILSDIVRREREYCCDDEVISIHGSSLEYAKALAQLEEWKLTKSTFALALAANKNQLLHRIKRIMEKTGEKYSTKDRLVPALLLIVGLVCASWLTVQKKDSSSQNQSSVLSQDTTIKKSKSSRTTIITFDENGEAHEQVFEEFDGDHDLAFWTPDVPPTPGFSMPAVPAMPSSPAFPAMPSFPGVPAVPSIPAQGWTPTADTIPGAWFHGHQNWEKFSEEFEKRFSEQFSEFYKTHEKDFDKMMKEMEERFKADFEHGSLQGFHEIDAERLHELAALGTLELSSPHNDLDKAIAAQEMALASIDNIRELAAVPTLEGWTADLSLVENNLSLLNENFANFNKSIKELLVNDGYLKKGEEIKSMKWDDDSIEINGKNIKKSDEPKYRKQHDAYFKEDFVPNRIE